MNHLTPSRTCAPLPSQLWLLAALFAVGCTHHYTLPVTRPAEADLKGAKKLAVGHLTTDRYHWRDDSETFAGELQSALHASKHFALVDRQHVRQVLKEHRLAGDGFVNRGSAVRLGKFIGARAIVVGKLVRHTYDETMTKRRFTRKTKSGKTHHVGYTRTGRAKVVANLRVIHLETGEVLGVKDVHGAYKLTRKATDQRPASIDKRALLRQARREAAQQFVRYIAPWEDTERFEAVSGAYCENFDRGVTFMEKGLVMEAQEVFAGCTKRHPLDHASLYHLALTTTMSGDPDTAKTMLDKAIRMEPDDAYIEARNKVNRIIEDARRVRKQRRSRSPSS